MIEACTFAVGAIGKQIPNPVKVKDRKYQKDFYCPRCGKQQKLPGVKRVIFGSYCERCGQRLSFPDPKTGKIVEVDETTFVFEVGV
jgi:transcription elongation factor Elf1